MHRKMIENKPHVGGRTLNDFPLFLPLLFPLSFFFLQNYTTSLYKIVQFTLYKLETYPSNEKDGLGGKDFIYYSGCSLFSPTNQQQWEVLLRKGSRKVKGNENRKGRREVEKKGYEGCPCFLTLVMNS